MNLQHDSERNMECKVIIIKQNFHINKAQYVVTCYIVRDQIIILRIKVFIA